MHDILRDVRFALRSLRKQPAFTAAVVLTLALGIGTSTAMFSLINAALIRPLPFDDPSRIAMLWGVFGPERDVRGASHREILDWRDANRSFEAISAYDEISVNLRRTGEPQRVEAEMVSASYFDVLGARAARGRTFLPEEDRIPDARPVAVISDAMWRSEFGADPRLVGKTITLNDRSFTVVGVMSAGFRGVSFDTDVWIPMMMISVNARPSLLEERRNRWLGAVGRLRPGVDMATAQRDIDAVAARLARAFPETNTDRGVQLFSLQDAALGTTRDLLITLFSAVMLFLLVACANVTNLQLVRANGRKREIALRVAVGANRARLLRQLLTEGVVLAAFGAAAGITLAVWGLGAFLPLLPDGALPRYVNPAVDWRVLGFATTLTLACGVIVGLVPALQGTRLDLADSLKEGSRSAAGGVSSVRRPGLQQLFVITEVALALVLLVAAALMIRSVQRKLAVDPGFRADGVVTAAISLPRGRYSRAAHVQLVDRIVERLEALPQVQSAAVGSDLPFNGVNNAAQLVVDARGTESMRYYRHRVTPGYFATLGIPLLRGRTFTSADRDSVPLVVVVSEAMARRFWPSSDPIGQHVWLGSRTGPSATIIGVVGTARFRDLTTNLVASTSEPDVFFPFAQLPDVDFSIAVRTTGSRSSTLAAMQRELRALDPGLPLYRAVPLSELVNGQTVSGRFGSAVLGAFSGVALLLAAIGIYGVLSFVISLSGREIAIRMALGATAGGVVALMVRQGMALVVVGLIVGLASASFVTSLLESQLFGVSATDPLTFAVVSGVFLFAGLLATYIPARRAARVDPQRALKGD